MSKGAAVMFAVSAVADAGGIYLLARLRRADVSESQTYAFRIAGTMALMLGLVLAGFATALWIWGRAG